jgi:hypothetical protein
MAYSDFQSLQSLEALGVEVIETTESFIQAEPIAPSAFLIEALKRFVPLATAINTEKARSEYLIAPLLSELTTLNPKLSLFSGRSLNVDPSRGLNGFCDFILTASPDKLLIRSPIVMIVEAKNENINDGLAQCIASMYAARLVNQNDPTIANHPTYGIVTTGQIWRFLVMPSLQLVKIDLNDRYLTPVADLLGIFVSITAGDFDPTTAESDRRKITSPPPRRPESPTS